MPRGGEAGANWRDPVFQGGWDFPVDGRPQKRFRNDKKRIPSGGQRILDLAEPHFPLEADIVNIQLIRPQGKLVASNGDGLFNKT